MLSEALQSLRRAGVVSALDEQLARTLCALGDEHDERVLLAIALLSRHVAAGHVCLPLRELDSAQSALGADASLVAEVWPASDAWLPSLRKSRLCGTGADANTPLVLDSLDSQARLYLRRHFDSERALAELLRARALQTLPADHERVAARLAHHFGRAEFDLQRSAAELATQRALCVISGGPGTGKTSTVVKILAVAVEEALAAGQPAPRIGLVAPTGKAAVRLQSAVRSAKQRLACEPRVLAAIPEQAATIHRLLLSRGRSERFEPGARAEPLPLELLLVDEASMVDLELMTTLLSALPEHARIILLGDRDQLASVEAGAVFGDICAVAGASAERGETRGLAQCIVQLTQSYRYGADSGIGRLARAVRAGDAEQALALLDDPRYPDVQLNDAEPLFDLQGAFARSVLSGFRPYLEARSDPERALQLFDGFRVLCAHRQGERGVVGLNRYIARVLSGARLLDAVEGHYAGRPILIRENDYRTRLWNGDIGLIVGAARERSACFVDADGALRRLGLGRLPPHESAFALSVHKSQGSEVDEVALVLPAEPSRLMSRELVYTALTRARTRVVIHGSRDVLRASIAQVVARNTGLSQLLRA